MNCNCHISINEKLAEQGLRLQEVFQITGGDVSGRLFLPAEKTDTGKASKVKVFFSHCPFCGELYVSENAEASEDDATNASA